ncbi:hypothetical protein GALL_116530 [mine drainage metagenome]|uniref:Flavinylation-associated cytochrome domain-containing protein n=1 Tax=mine drainage metagenome TaxID=410659 RepID=A0A1J5SQ49_9ZZZZ
MNFTVRDIVTPLAAILFLVMAVSGVALFFHITPNLFRTAHEWLGLLFAALAVWHASRYWRGLLGYLKRPVSLIAITLAVGLSLATIGLTGTLGHGRGNPHQVIEALAQAPLDKAAAAFGLTGPEALARLQAKGISAEAGQPVREVARNAHMRPVEMLALLSGQTAGDDDDD